MLHRTNALKEEMGSLIENITAYHTIGVMGARRGTAELDLARQDEIAILVAPALRKAYARPNPTMGGC
jgi:hypothetical protein